MNIEVILFVGLVILFTSVGGFYVAQKDTKRLAEWLPPFLSLGTGILLALAFTEFLPHSFEKFDSYTSWWIVFGVVFVIGADKFVAPLLGPGHDHCSHHSHGAQLISKSAACSSIGCIIVCAFFDGIEIYTAFQLSREVGWFLSIGLLFHVVPEGAIAAGLSLAGGFSKRSAQKSVLSIALAMMLGVGFGAFIIKFIDFQRTLLPFATGVLIYVAIGHLMPVALKKKWGIVGVIIGVVFVFASGHFVGHSH